MMNCSDVREVLARAGVPLIPSVIHDELNGYRHGLSHAEVEDCLAQLVDAGLIAVDEVPLVESYSGDIKPEASKVDVEYRYQLIDQPI